jgi:putative membrane protein
VRINRTYQLIKSLHIVAVISWMAGLLYLYRLYVNHHGADEAVMQERFRGLERRLWFAITVPAARVTALSGVAMIWYMGCAYAPAGSLTAKPGIVVALLGVHFLAGHYRQRFAEPPPYPLTERAFRFLN